jgi:hypothetical protein
MEANASMSVLNGYDPRIGYHPSGTIKPDERPLLPLADGQKHKLVGLCRYKPQPVAVSIKVRGINMFGVLKTVGLKKDLIVSDHSVSPVAGTFDEKSASAARSEQET